MVGRRMNQTSLAILPITDRSVLFKCCPRCRGDIVRNRDHFGYFLQCVQCGYLEDIVRPQRGYHE
ncbi:hypothetical protein LCGC14_1717140 [marine sediment metagenome]|uniref:Uncharacterized protein n=1 Tax=marine sediment metagenome TaxID=412755 RepID=A0A0F9HDR3_9ZZZZ